MAFEESSELRRWIFVSHRVFFPIFNCVDPFSESGSTKLLNTDLIWIRINSNGYRKKLLLNILYKFLLNIYVSVFRFVCDQCKFSIDLTRLQHSVGKSLTHLVDMSLSKLWCYSISTTCLSSRVDPVHLLFLSDLFRLDVVFSSTIGYCQDCRMHFVHVRHFVFAAKITWTM